MRRVRSMLCLVVATTVAALTLTTAPAVSVEDLPVLQNLEPPVLSGDAWPGETLQVSDGAWDADEVQLTYQWLRDGQPVEGATDAAYPVTDADRGSQLSAAVTASAEGYAPGTATSDAMWVPDLHGDPMSHRVRAKLVRPVLGVHQHPRLRVQVLDTGTVSGRLSAYVDRVRERTVRLLPEDHGRARLRLPRQAPGRHTVVVFFDEDGAMGPSGDRVHLRVRG